MQKFGKVVDPLLAIYYIRVKMSYKELQSSQIQFCEFPFREGPSGPTVGPSGPAGGPSGPAVGLQPPALELKLIYILLLS